MKGIIFDLDGVICFTDKYHYQAWKILADKIGVEFTEKDNDRLRGVSRMASLEIILEKYHGSAFTPQQKEAMACEKNNTYRELLKQMQPGDVAQEVRDTLTALRGRGYRLAIGSSSKNARFILERTAMTVFFDAISDGNNISYSKPNPEVFLKAAEFLSLEPSNCAVVEDAWAGIEAAKAGGMTAVAIGSAVTSPQADIRLERFSDLLKLFDQTLETNPRSSLSQKKCPIV